MRGGPFGTIVYKEAYGIIDDEIDRMGEEMSYLFA